MFKNIGKKNFIFIRASLRFSLDCYENYEIWIAGITVEGRKELMETGDPWINTNHRFFGKEEEEFLKRLLQEGKIKRLIPEIDDNIHNSQGRI